jgi:hypothetical protein
MLCVSGGNYHDLLDRDGYENRFKRKLRIIYIMRSFLMAFSLGKTLSNCC